jgi:alditol oxidase
MNARLTNWAGNVTFGTERLHRPSSVEELQELVAGSDRLRTLGTGHSFNRIADSTGDLVSLADLPRLVELDPERSTVTVGGGVRYGELASALGQHGYALHNLGSLPHISVAGACSTGTHGSGDSNGNLATAVSGLELVTADGEMVTLTRADGDRFRGAVVGLGSLGVVTSLTLDVQPSYDIRQYVYEDLPVAQLDDHFDEIVGSAYSVSLFTDWRGASINQVWLKRRVGADDPEPPDGPWMGAIPARAPRNPLPGMSAATCTQQLGVQGPWNDRLPHFRLEFTPSSGEELQTEYLLPRHLAIDALHAVGRLRDRLARVLQISEIRTVAADDLWMSSSYGRDSVAIHFTWIKDTRAVTPVVAAVEEQLAPFQARPHWGKLFVMDPDTVRGLYPRVSEFERLLRDYDPAGKFRNAFVDRYFSGER